MEHRWGERVPLGIRVRVSGNSACIGTGLLRDASVSGAFVQTELRLPQHAQLVLEIASGDGAATVEEVPASVVRHDPCGIGMEWREFAPRAILLLLAISVPAPSVDPTVPLSHCA